MKVQRALALVLAAEYGARKKLPYSEVVKLAEKISQVIYEGNLTASDGSEWERIDTASIGGCEVCGRRQAWRWACVEGRWEGAICVACTDEHAIEAIEGFINNVGQQEETN